ncbi:MAG: hypothetical protein IPF99_42655 [Deltaproteobacteria bacterium]|nr:hypothetical protein [Deltaproteobacteria bacterium]
MIASRCTAIIGLDDQDHPGACAGLRRPMISIAARIDPPLPPRRGPPPRRTSCSPSRCATRPPATLRARAENAGAGTDLEEAQAALHNA